MDRLLVERGLATTREKARRLVLAGDVLVDESPVVKPGTLVDRRAALRLRREPAPYVGRGGEKLAGALEDLSLDVRGLAVLDIGASTGGFTDCLLKHGARAVTALDVGRGQLDWKLRSDPRVTVLEGVNARYLTREHFPEPFDLITIDVSFISLRKILPAARKLIRESGRILALVKPQFELSRAEVGPGGIVRRPALHEKALRSVTVAARSEGLLAEDAGASRLAGAEGNREFFLLLRRREAGSESFEDQAKLEEKLQALTRQEPL